MELEFWKMSGAGNDFIAINNMDGRLHKDGREELFASWCRRGMSIGADGVLVVEPSKKSSAHFRMRYHNADGREAETCGNGSRCIARFAYEQGIAPQKLKFETAAGDYDAEVLDSGEVKVRMTEPFDLRESVEIPVGAGTPFAGEAHFLNTGVPHLVLFVDDLDNADVRGVGKFLRYHELFAPAGTNVNFVAVRDPHHIDVRTYERGVEDETLACGTGSIASAILATRQLMTQSPVGVRTASGEVLTIGFEPTATGARNVTLQGSAHMVYRAYVDCRLLDETAATKPRRTPGLSLSDTKR